MCHKVSKTQLAGNKRVEEWIHKAIAKHAGVVWLDKNEDLTTIPACFAIALWIYSSTRFVTG